MKIKPTDILNFIASNLGFTPSGGVSSTNVQDALEELDSEKVTGPASATDNAIARYDGTTGKVIQNSQVFIDDSNQLGVNTVPARPFHVKHSIFVPSTIAAFENADSTDGNGSVFSGRTTTTGGGGSAFTETCGFRFVHYDHNHATVTGGIDLFAMIGGVFTITFRTTSTGGIQFPQGLVNAADDVAAASAGVAINQLYRNGSQVMIRVT